MERNTPVRKPHTSTADLLTWSEVPHTDPPPSGSAQRSAARSHQPSDGVSNVLFGGQITDEEAESLANKKPCSGYKLKEMTGSGIFNGIGIDESESDSTTSANRTGLRVYQQAINGISQISFTADESISPKKPTSITEVAKQRELSGTLNSELDAMTKKQISDAKFKEISGHDIFAPPPEIQPRTFVAAHNLVSKEGKDMSEPGYTSVKASNLIGGQSSNIFFSEEESTIKTAKKLHDQKFAELTGNDIFKGDVPPGSAEKPLSQAKLREMSGSDIFADGKANSREYLGGVRKPPGGESSISLV